ncbi:hypothetical protein EW093_15110 [Thiospirochaeta perfilievii]|uniref:Uncharacterized protein n=1 Tax=Thiospirochaeta perfilievii TaxID=252967 RepID=A0A5C1QF07_9SPIO|nr:hypothetical protein [Thiospirochaeta perfilievii]QEN05968.1 hypothetical protein EW093_15110 [Thiospirochaeta perfilievii]
MIKSIKLLLLTTIFTVLPLVADDFFDDFATDEAGSTNGVEISGSIDLGLRSYNFEDMLDETADVDTNANLKLTYQGSLADITLTTKVNKESITLDECYTNMYFDKFNVEAGILKTVWGKGDKLHVVDLLNPTDYSTYFITDYLENKIATPTVKFNIPLGATGLLELAYLPTFSSDVLPTSGRWVPNDVKVLLSTVTNLVKSSAAAKYGEVYTANIGTATPEQIGNATGLAYAASLEVLQAGSDMSQYYQDTNSLSFGQYAVRGTASLSGYDLGLLYYYGYNSKPELNESKMLLEYEKKQMIGLEFGRAILGFNLRGELAYYLMDKSENSLNYVAGFDYNFPIHNLNLNAQIKGNYFLDSENDNTNMVVGKLSDTFNHEATSLSVTTIYFVEDKDFMIKPEFTTNIGDTTKLEITTCLFNGDSDTMLGQYDDNDYISVNINYMF